MTSDEKGEQGRGLPVGWGWRPVGATMLLCAVGDEDVQAIAAVGSTGLYALYPDKGTAMLDGELHKPTLRDGESATSAAQREAEAALWARDGFGVGEVRGLVLGDEWLDHIATILDLPTVLPVALPGLPGMWKLTRITSAQPITVNAARVTMSPNEHADGCAYYFADAADAESLCNCRGGTPRVTVEPGKPLPVSFSGLRAAGYEVAEPAPREPPAPTDDTGDELARPSPDRAAWLLHPVSSTGRETIAASQYEELRGEAVALRARVDELEAERTASIAQEITLRTRAAEAEAAMRRTPPPGTVAALLAKVEEEAKRAHDAEIAEFVSGTSEWSESEKVLYLDGIAHGLRYGAELATATLGAPTPLDLAVREVCALLPREYPEDAHGLPVLRARRKLDAALADLGEGDVLGARVSIVDAAADLLAGMLACGAPADGGKERA